MAVVVTWDLYTSDPEDADAELSDIETVLNDWADRSSNADAAAGEIVETEMNCRDWNRNWFDEAGNGGTVWLVVKSPPSIAGKYEVAVERRVVATAERQLVSAE